MILRKFHMCNLEVKLTLFRSFCTPMYTSQLWWNYRKSSINKLYISYHNIFKLFIGFSKYESTGTLCTVFDVQCCQAVIRNLVYKFMQHLDRSVNPIICAILDTSLKYKSRIRTHWLQMLQTSQCESTMTGPVCMIPCICTLESGIKPLLLLLYYYYSHVMQLLLWT